MVMMTMMMVMTMCCVFETSTDAASWMTRPSLSLGTRFTSTNVITGVTTPITIILHHHHHHHHDQDHAKPDSEYLGALQVVLLPLATRPTATVAKTGAPGDDDENDDGENDEDDDDNQLAAASESEDRCLGGSGLL